jgi:4-oxalocrotonate tautomerase
MPHIIVKMQTGRSDELKSELAQSLTHALMATLGSAETSVSVAIEDVRPSDWVEQVYKPCILGKAETLYKKPGLLGDEAVQHAPQRCQVLVTRAPVEIHPPGFVLTVNGADQTVVLFNVHVHGFSSSKIWPYFFGGRSWPRLGSWGRSSRLPRAERYLTGCTWCAAE